MHVPEAMNILRITYEVFVPRNITAAQDPKAYAETHMFQTLEEAFEFARTVLPHEHPNDCIRSRVEHVDSRALR